MRVTGLAPVTKNKWKVYVDDEFAFILYKGELLRLNIEEGSQISDAQYRDILQDIVVKRGKRRALALLEKMGRTEKQLRDKLEEEYPEDVVNQILTYVINFGYVNDREYARQYIEIRRQKKSQREIFADLLRKGINQDVIAKAYEETAGDDGEAGTLVTLMKKRKFDPDRSDFGYYEKHVAYFARKGFSYGDIQKAVELLKQEEFSKR